VDSEGSLGGDTSTESCEGTRKGLGSIDATGSSEEGTDGALSPAACVSGNVAGFRDELGTSALGVPTSKKVTGKQIAIKSRLATFSE
jgi:hypothetical protein